MTQNPSLTSDSRGDPTVPGAIPEPFRGIIRECLHLDPKRRCSTADILARLQPAARSVPAEHHIDAPLPPARRGISRGAITLAVVVLAVLIALLLFYSRGKHETAQAPSAPEPERQSAPAASGPTVSSQPPVSPKPSASPERAPAPKSAPRDVAKADSGGVAVHQVLPDVPKSARNTITGKIKVVVKVDVNSAGKVTSAKLTTAGPSHYFANLAMKAAKQWEFSPPQTNGQAQPSVWAIRFSFGRARTEATPEHLKRP